METTLKDLKEKYNLLSYDIKQNIEELNSLTINTFALNPRISEITQELKILTEEKNKIEEEINKMETMNG